MSEETEPNPTHSKGVSKRKFSQEEDNFILKMVSENGLHYWKQIADQLGTRTPRQCRERWKHYLSPGIESGPWTPEEDLILQTKYHELGPKWSIIRESLPGRTDVNIKNRYALISRRTQRITEGKNPVPRLPIERKSQRTTLKSDPPEADQTTIETSQPAAAQVPPSDEKEAVDSMKKHLQSNSAFGDEAADFLAFLCEGKVSVADLEIFATATDDLSDNE